MRMGIDLHRITLGALIIALGLLVDDAIIAVEMMVVKMEQGWDRVRAATVRLDVDRLPDADRHAGHGRRLPAGRLRQIQRSANTPAASSGSSAIALVASWFVAVVFTPYLGREAPADFQAHGRSTIPTRSTTRGSTGRSGA